MFFNIHRYILARSTSVTWMVLIAALCATLSAQTTLPGQLVVHPVTSDDILNYNLPATVEHSAGVTTVAIGTGVILETQVDINVPASQISSVTWAITKAPANSQAALSDSPLGADIPIAEPSDRVIYQAAQRKLLRPDVAGLYSVQATVVTAGSGTGVYTVMLTASTYVGVGTCSLCHSGGPAQPWSMVDQWSKTPHATFFKNAISGVSGYISGVACMGCHTVGYDPNTTVGNGGFFDLATQFNWTYPKTMQPSNWDNMPAALKNVSNIQCENCHGPGSMHVNSGGDPRLISATNGRGVCSQCHAEITHHFEPMGWDSSAHAVTTRDATGTGREACVGCHTGTAFVDKVNGVTTVNTAYSAITCQSCHEPHGATTPTGADHQIRTLAPVKLQDGTTVSNAGLGTLCMNCHQARVNAATYVPNTAGNSHYGPHHGPQADMLEGVNGFTYGKNIPSSAHGDVVSDTCVTCHMQTLASNDPAAGFVGGHTFKLGFSGNETVPAKEIVAACQGCHGPDVTTLNFALMDYDGDGVIDGAQTEVQHLLDQLALLLPPAGQAKSSLNIDSSWTQPQLQAAYNYLFVQSDGSRGIHNMAYTVGLLNVSIADLKARSGK